MHFEATLNDDTIFGRPDLDTTRTPAGRRHVEIIHPKAGSHRRAGQIYLQNAT